MFSNRVLAIILATFALLTCAQAQESIRSANDPCFANLATSASISVSTGVTTQLVALSGVQAIYVCGFTLTVAPSATTADTAQFEYGTGTNCGTGTQVLTGSFGAGVTVASSSAPTQVVDYGKGTETIFVAPSGNALCIVTAGNTVNVQGVVTYVQQ